MTERSPWSRINTRKLAERFAIELGPALVFVIALQALDLDRATILFVAALAAAFGYGWFQKGHFPLIPAGMVLLAAVFGALTVAFDEAAFIEFRATVVNAGGAIAIIAGLLTGRLVLKTSLQDGFRLSDGAWWVLSIRMAAYLLLMAALNEVVWRLFSTEVWAWFKTASPLLNVAFLLLNRRLIAKNLVAEEDGADAPAADASPPRDPALHPEPGH